MEGSAARSGPFSGTGKATAPGEHPSPGSPDPVRHRLNMALQGGGTHGAFTWGVLEALLQDERIEFHALSGTSAGGINGALVAQGIVEGGRAGAIAKLEHFWSAMAAQLAFSPLRNNPLEKLIWGHDLTFSVAWQSFDAVTRILSPYQFNPLGLEFNPLREALEHCIDPALLHDPRAPELHVTATNVRTGKPKVFSGPEVTVDALLASACLPNLFQAVEIDGEAYWDGGYVANPALWPLYDRGGPPDIVVVQVNPLGRIEIPHTVSEILTRVNEISFNASMMSEMRAVDFVQRLVDSGALSGPKYKRLFVHLIEDEEAMRRYSMSTKYNGDWDFLCELRHRGRMSAGLWLEKNFDALGRRDSVDVRLRFL